MKFSLVHVIALGIAVAGVICSVMPLIQKKRPNQGERPGGMAKLNSGGWTFASQTCMILLFALMAGSYAHVPGGDFQVGFYSAVAIVLALLSIVRYVMGIKQASKMNDEPGELEK